MSTNKDNTMSAADRKKGLEILKTSARKQWRK